MWKELTVDDNKLLSRYKEVMDLMDKFYTKYTAENYRRMLRRGDKGFYYSDGSLEYFMMFHWNEVRRQWKIQCVGFTGSSDSVSVADLGFEFVKKFMADNSVQLYAVRPNVMDNNLINKHHDRWIEKQETVIEALKENDTVCQFRL